MNKTKILETARSVLKSEIIGLERLSEELGDNFITLVKKIQNTTGRVIVSGMGKSGHIARKIAATLASTGTSAFFVHPGEASHGDLGMIHDNDIVMLLSNSGETKELKDIIYYCKRFDICLVAVVRNENSSLALASNIVIHIPNSPEALEFDAPTTSSTMMLGFGDALALTLLDQKGFSRDDFQVFHPGGRLGASFIKIVDIMHKGKELPIIHSNTSMAEAIAIINEKKFGCGAVVNENSELIGFISDGDIRRNIENILSKKPEEIMIKNPVTIKETALAIEALETMNKKRITTLLVLDNNKKLQGIVHMHDCLQAGASPNY